MLAKHVFTVNLKNTTRQAHHIRPKKKPGHLRFTIYDLESSARGAREAAKQMRTGCDEAVIGRGYKGAEAGGAWPFTMDDLNASTLRAFLRNKSKAEFSKTMVVAPMYDCKACARCAGKPLA